MGHGTLGGGSLSLKGRFWFLRECVVALGIGCGVWESVGSSGFVGEVYTGWQGLGRAVERSQQEVRCQKWHKE